MNDLFAQLFVSVPTGLGSAWLATVQFQAQSRWQQKEAGYREVLEALHEMKRTNQVWYDAALENREIPEARSALLISSWRAAQKVAYKYADIGEFALSPMAEKILDSLRTQIEKRHESYFDSVDSDGYEVERALKELKVVALNERRRALWWKFQPPKWMAVN